MQWLVQWFVVGVVLALTLVGCQRTGSATTRSPELAPAASEPSDEAPWPVLSTELLELVPADTPYVLSQDEPLPAVAVQRLAPVLEPMRTLLELGFAQAHEGSDPQLKRATEALFGGPPSVAALAEIGLDLNPRFVMYGIGLAPVLRLRLRDPDAFRRAVDKAAAQSEGRRSAEHFHGQAYLASQPASGGVSVIAIVGPDLVVAMLPSNDLKDELLPLIFGQRLPDASLASTGLLADVRRRHGLERSVSGYFDFRTALAAYAGWGSELNRRVAVALGVGKAALDPVCADELRRLMDTAPRFVVGFAELSSSSMVWSQTIETSPEVARRLATLPGSLPETAPRTGSALATFGFGLNLSALADAATALADAIQREPFRCPQFEDLNEAAALTEVGLAELPPELFGLSGISMSVYDFAPGQDGGTDGVVVLAVEDPKALLSALSDAGEDVHLDRLKLRRPVALGSVVDREPDDEGDDILADAWIARGRHSIGLALGRASRRDLLAALDRRRPDDGTLMFASMDFAAWMERNRDPVERLLRLKGRMLEEFAHGVLALLSRVELRVAANDQGLSLLVDLRAPTR